MRSYLIPTVVLAILTTLGLPASAQVNLLQNGDFESPVIAGNFQSVPPGTLTDWTVGGAGIEIISNNYWQSSSGVQSIDLSALDAGSISQTVALTPGLTYSLFFDLAGNPEGGDAIKDVQIDITGQSSSTEQFNITGFNRFNMGWSTRTITFVAISASTTVRFTSLENNPFGPALDNVQLSIASAAPEPGTLALLVLGGLPLTAKVLHRRRCRQHVG